MVDLISWPLCFADEGRNAVDLAGGAQIVAEHIKSLSQNPEPGNEKLLTVFCGMLMNYSSDNGNDHPSLRRPLHCTHVSVTQRINQGSNSLRRLCFSVLG